MAARKLWRRRSGENPQPKFYKIIFSPLCSSLRIPEDFASKYCKNNLQNLAYLEAPSGKLRKKSQGEHEQQPKIILSKNEENVIEHSVENIGHCSFGQARKRKRQDGAEEDDVSVGTQNNVIEEEDSQWEHEQQSEIVPSKSEVEGHEEIAVNYQRVKILEVCRPDSHRGKAKVQDVVEHSLENIGHCLLGQTSKRKRQDGVEKDDVSVDIQPNGIEEEESQGGVEEDDVSIDIQPNVIEEEESQADIQTNIIEEEKSQREHKQQSKNVPSNNEVEGREEIVVNYQRAKIPEACPDSHKEKAKVRNVVEHSLENIGHCLLGQTSKRKRQDRVEEDYVSVDNQTNVIDESKSNVEGGEEIVANYQRAKTYKSNNPFIIFIMRPFYVSHSFSLSIPKKFAKRYFPNRCNLVLSVTGKGSWSVKCTIGRRNAKFIWKAFVLDNKLKTGDVCVFEVIEGTILPLSINVTIFPAVSSTSMHEIAREEAGALGKVERVRSRNCVGEGRASCPKGQRGTDPLPPRWAPWHARKS
ncbi:hypothetical protein HAX54_049880, partial [Datura stramonium]|nr:hypothetical protein [Datura stramonium]